MGVRRHTRTHQDQSCTKVSADHDGQHVMVADGRQTQRRLHSKHIPTTPKARCFQRQGSRLGSSTSGVRFCALAGAFLFAVILRAVLLQNAREWRKVQILVIRDESVVNDPRYHNFTAVAHGLAHNGLHVALGSSSLYEDDMDPEDSLEYFQGYDAVLLQGPSATTLADHVAHSNTSAVRFVGVRELGINDDIPPLSERPNVIVLGSNSGKPLPKEPGLQFTPVMELPVGSVHNYRAKQYKELVQRMWPLCKTGHFMKAARERDAEATKDIMGLVIIANNEALRIHDPLLSMKDHIDAWTVLENNSTDNTTAVVEQLMRGKPGRVVHAPFKDFSTARNLALKSHGGRTKYVVMLDADMSIPAAWRLRVTLQRLALLCADWAEDSMCSQAFKMQAFLDGIKFFTIRVFPTIGGIGTDRGWHYTYPVHEIPQHLNLPPNAAGIDAVMKIMTVDIIIASDPLMRHVARARKLDLQLLRAERERRPDDQRVSFYLAQTLHTLDMLPEAVAAYEDRVGMGGWYEEIFESLLRKGKILMSIGGNPMRDLMRAAEVSPYRAEPYMVMALHHAKLSGACNATGWHDSACFLRHHVAALHYGKRASDMPQPRKDLMFVDVSTYTSRALAAVVDHGFQVAWKTRGAARMGRESAGFLSSYRGAHPCNATRARQLLDKYADLPSLVAPESIMWA